MIKINEKYLCSGCHSCFNICPTHCISMETDNEGFLYPKVKEEICLKCGLCVQSCPIVRQKNNKNEPQAYAAYNCNENIRMNSSSGGIFYLIAKKIIEKNGVVFGAKFNENNEVVHDFVDKEDEIHLFQGSKYVQSKIGDSYNNVKKFLESNRIVLFSGTPCQIDGLLTFLNKSYENLYCQDIVCHGVPSPKVWETYLKDCNIFEKANINFRDKTTGWETYSFKLDTRNIKIQESARENKFMEGFLKNLYLRPSCYNCHSKSIHRSSDLTLADFWGINNIDETMNDHKGTSLVMVNSEKGFNLFKKIEDDIIYKEVNINKAIEYNPSIYKSVKKPKKREVFFSNLNVINFEDNIKACTKLSLIEKIKIKIKLFFK